MSRQNTTAGFLTVSAWSLEAEDRGSSTEHTPARVPSVNANHSQQVSFNIIYLTMIYFYLTY